MRRRMKKRKQTDKDTEEHQKDLTYLKRIKHYRGLYLNKNPYLKHKLRKAVRHTAEGFKIVTGVSAALAAIAFIAGAGAYLITGLMDYDGTEMQNIDVAMIKIGVPIGIIMFILFRIAVEVENRYGDERNFKEDLDIEEYKDYLSTLNTIRTKPQPHYAHIEYVKMKHKLVFASYLEEYREEWTRLFKEAETLRTENEGLIHPIDKREHAEGLCHKVDEELDRLNTLLALLKEYRERHGEALDLQGDLTLQLEIHEQLLDDKHAVQTLIDDEDTQKQYLQTLEQLKDNYTGMLEMYIETKENQKQVNALQGKKHVADKYLKVLNKLNNEKAEVR